MPQKTYFNWSTGKDSALSLYHLLNDENYEVQQLITTVNAHHDRVSMHGLRRELMEKQVAALNIPFTTIELPEQPTMEEYEALMVQTVSELTSQGFTTAAFGDIFLEDLKKYREDQLAKYNIGCVFPIWKRDTKDLLHEFIDLGFKSIVVCINGELLDQSFAGRIIDQDFINDLPKNVDPCGENGEFHTFCFDGPIFSSPIKFEIGEKVHRTYPSPNGKEGENLGFWFCDLLPSSY